MFFSECELGDLPRSVNFTNSHKRVTKDRLHFFTSLTQQFWRFFKTIWILSHPINQACFFGESRIWSSLFLPFKRDRREAAKLGNGSQCVSSPELEGRGGRSGVQESGKEKREREKKGRGGVPVFLKSFKGENKEKKRPSSCLSVCPEGILNLWKKEKRVRWRKR